ncbi:FMN-binding glutamate synthase family protein [Paenibacillus lignilyticus]|uniref:FMN-binding glutamate synthase family protein n=1 Tax=Paenibacillus lignilyticus TaxID=1172615 RepID=A0ABS5CGD4_9BACL|nr:FMN-binding glutamate synthase family protein [Paenibacillus lignilyticus]MBP3964900.1 FMN-binding glutamate synthase family protein [Paenibacillus lignilyticus]
MVSTILITAVFLLVALPLLAFFSYMYILSKRPKHSIIRSHPFLGWVRYLLEKLGPEFRQYWFDNDTEGRPFSRADFVGIVYAAKYRTDLISFGGRRDYEKPGFYLSNAMFPKLTSELKVDNLQLVPGRKYVITDEGLFTRKEKTVDENVKRWLLADDDVIIVGQDRPQPWRLKGMFGASATSFGAVGENYIQSTGSGAAMAGGSWINTGEGGVAHVHLATGADVVSQIGPGMFGFRDNLGKFSIDEFKRKAEIPNIKAFELKFHQGAKIRGGHLEGSKVTEAVAAARLVPVGQTVNSPNRFELLTSPEEALRFIGSLQEAGGKPVGIKIVVGDPQRLEPLFSAMLELDIYPDFITVDGSEGGSGATFKAMADGMGLPLYAALIILDDTARKFGVRERIRIFASGKLITPDKVAIALALGADCVNSARGFMMANGCIMALQCHTGKCPTGITTTDAKYQAALAPEEKQWRVMNYILQLREGLFSLSAACGLDSPRGLRREHVVFTTESGQTTRIADLFPYPEPQ